MATKQKMLSEYMSTGDYQPRNLLRQVREAFARGDLGDNVIPVSQKMKFGKGGAIHEANDASEKGTFFDFLIVDSGEFERWLGQNADKFTGSAPSSAAHLLSREQVLERLKKGDLDDYLRAQRQEQHKKMQQAERVRQNKRSKSA